MKKIGIVIAMEEEFQAMENKIKEIKVHEEKGLKFFEGKIGEKECVIVKSGVGKVNAARTTQAMIDNFDIEYIINMGASGKGHLTDYIIEQTLKPIKVNIIFDKKTKCDVHPNTMVFVAYKQDREIGRWMVYSIGGGTIKIEKK